VSRAATPSARLTLRGRTQLDDYPVAAVWSPDAGQLAVVGGEGAVLLLPRDALTGSGAASADTLIGRHPGGGLAIAWQGGGRLFASSGQDGAVLLWDARTRQSQRLLQSAEWPEHLAFSSHGRLLAAAAGRRLHIFDAAGNVRHSFDAQPGVISAVAWRPRASEVAAVGNGGARLHRLEPDAQTREYAWAGACLTASWSADGRVLAAGLQDGSVHLWYPSSATQSEMKGYGVKVALTEWSGNGRYLCTGAGDMVVIWDFSGRGPEGSRPLELRGHTARLAHLSCRPAGAWLVSIGRDRRLLLWRIGAAGEPLDAHLLAGESTLLRWSNDGRWLAVGDSGGGLSLFEFAA
jgi:WD40 repeat protein